MPTDSELSGEQGGDIQWRAQLVHPPIMNLKHYAVTVMGDRRMLRRSFWTLRGARRWRDSFASTSHVHLFRWNARWRWWDEFA